MEFTLADQYFLKAKDHYPHNLEDTMENLNYALSYDESHVQANHLMGRIYMYHMKEYDAAGHYFNVALTTNMDYPDTYEYYCLLKLWMLDYKGALKLINYGMNVKGVNKSALLLTKAIVFECTGNYKIAKQILRQAILYCIDTDSIDVIKGHMGRLKEKKKIHRKSSKSIKKLAIA